MKVKIKKLIKNINFEKIKGSKETEVSGICDDSRFASPGSLFIAKKGHTLDGADYIDEALKAGVKAIVSDMYNPFIKDKNIVQLIHEDPAQIEADMAASFYDFPGKKLFTHAITGTNGKTTTSYLIKHVLDSIKKTSGLLGTIEYIINDSKFPSTLTTPGSVTLQKYLNEMVNQKCEHAIMEVSSHGLAQNRVKNIFFDVAIFTNLTQDHLDYHYCIEHYADAKKKLFDGLQESSKAIVNIDDFWSARMIENTKAAIITYGIKNKADFYAENIKSSISGLSFDLHYKNKSYVFTSKLIGKFNVYNILAAVAALVQSGISIEEIALHLSSFSPVRGRLEQICNEEKNTFSVFVDYAHTPDALKNTLKTLKEITKNKIITVFGCGGDRDKGKRKKMGKVTSIISDLSIVTSDNPRKEDPREIIEQIAQGFVKDSSIIIEEDREKAIAKAINIAQEGDVVLIAGKGHETTQIFANKAEFFDDRQIAQNLLNSKRG